MLALWVTPPQVQYPTLALDPHEISLCPSLQPNKVLLNTHQPLLQFCIIMKLVEGAVYPYIQALDELRKTDPEMIPRDHH